MTLKPCPCCKALPDAGESRDRGYAVACVSRDCQVRPLVGQRSIYSEPISRTPDEVDALWNSLTEESSASYGQPFEVWFARMTMEVERQYQALPEEKKAELIAKLKEIWKTKESL